MNCLMALLLWLSLEQKNNLTSLPPVFGNRIVLEWFD